MICYKLDNEKVDRVIEVYKDEHDGKNPRLICSKKTYDKLLQSNNNIYVSSCGKISIGGYTLSENNECIKELSINGKKFVNEGNEISK